MSQATGLCIAGTGTLTTNPTGKSKGLLIVDAPAHLLSSQGVAGVKMEVSQSYSRIMLYGSREGAALHDGLIHGHHIFLRAQGFMAVCNFAPQLFIVILW